MLARTFKSAAELNISDRQHDALLRTLEFFEGGGARHKSFTPGDVLHMNIAGIPPAPNTTPTFFNMNFWASSLHDCGTICCIGGTADYLAGAQLFPSNAESNAGLEDLFYLTDVDDADNTHALWDAITPAQATTALHNYLTLGVPRWCEVLGLSA